MHWQLEFTAFDITQIRFIIAVLAAAALERAVHELNFDLNVMEKVLPAILGKL